MRKKKKKDKENKKFIVREIHLKYFFPPSYEQYREDTVNLTAKVVRNLKALSVDYEYSNQWSEEEIAKMEELANNMLKDTQYVTK